MAELLLQVKGAIPEESEDSPTQLEVITPAAWLYFQKEQMDIAVIEVGLGCVFKPFEPPSPRKNPRWEESAQSPPF